MQYFLHNQIPVGMISIVVADFLTFRPAFNRKVPIHLSIDLSWSTLLLSSFFSLFFSGDLLAFSVSSDLVVFLLWQLLKLSKAK